MESYSPYINELIKDCALVDYDDFEYNANEPEYMWDSYSIDSDNNITHLSVIGMSDVSLYEICNIESLKFLILRGCNIDKIPSEIRRLKSLYKLDLSDNHIKSIPNDLMVLSELSELRLSNNQIACLPNNFGDLNGLVWCYLDFNFLDVIPSSFCDINLLDKLVLSGNKLNSLPDDFGRLIHLVELYLDSNKLKSLPVTMSSMINIDRLSLSDNNFSIDLDELKGMDARNIINMIINIDKEQTAPLNELKIIFVGDERVGKTSVINRMIGGDYDVNCESTEGVDIKSGFEIGKYKANIWDFAGQEITHQTHQFFLSKRSLYFLTIDSQIEDDSYSIYNWLSTIKSYGGDESPIIVIVNKIDINSGYVFDIELYKRDFNIKEVVYSSAKENKFYKINNDSKVFILLSDLVYEQIHSINGLDFQVPLPWMDVKSRLESNDYCNRDIIELDEFESICSEYEVSSFEDQNTLLALLHQIGTVVAYNDHARLNLIQIINPRWLTNAVYKIIRSDEIKSNGVLDYSVIKKIFLGDHVYKNSHFRWLMDLLIQFKLAFEIEDNKLLIPARVSNSQPEFDMNEYQKGFGFRFDYNNFLKRNVLSQLIVNLNYMIDLNTEMYWKRGVFLCNKLSKAVVIFDEFKKTIDVFISDVCPSSIELRTTIIGSINKINNGKYDVDEMVAIKEHGNVISYESYDYLLELLHNGYDETIIKVRDDKTKKLKPKKINIKKLLYGYDNAVKGFDYNTLTLNIVRSLLLIAESRRVVFHENENLITTRLRDMLLSRGYIASDQSLGGESFSAKSEGERDIVIRSQQGESKAVIESLNLSYLNKTEINEHYKKLVCKYDTSGHKCNYMIVYAKSKSFGELCEKYSSQFSHAGHYIYNDEYSLDSDYVKVAETNIENKKVFHILVNLYSSQ